jgi:hypothetical protein
VLIIVEVQNMKYIRLFVALLAACIFVVPAFSMPENGNAMKDGSQQIDGPCPNCIAGGVPECPQNCDCQNARLGPDGNNGPRSMMDGKKQGPCCQNAKIGPDANNGPQFAMGGEQQNPCCQNARMGPDGNSGPRSMMGGEQQNPCCQNAKIGPDGNNGPQLGN